MSLQPQEPTQIEFSPNLYFDNLSLSWVSTTTLGCTTGECRDYLNIMDIGVTNPNNLTNPLVLNSAINGIGGLDTGTVAANTLYWVFVIADWQGFNLPALMMSTSPTAPIMPFGYGTRRRLGRVLTDGSAHFLPFIAAGHGNTKFIQMTSLLPVLSGGTSATFAAVNLLIGIPGTSVNLAAPVYLEALYTPTGTASVASIRPTGSATASLSCPVELKSNVAAVSIKFPMVKVLPGINSGNLSIDYLVTGGDALTLSLSAFEELL